MTELLGNGMHVGRIGLAVGLAVSFVSAQPIPNERKVYVRLVVEMAADHGLLYGHSGCTRPGAQEEGDRQRKGHRQEARYCTKKVSQNQKRPKKKEARRKSPKKPLASLPIKRHQHVWEARGKACTADVIVMKPVCPSSSWSCRTGFERVCSLPRFGFQYRTGYRYPLVYCVSTGNDIIQVSSCPRVPV